MPVTPFHFGPGAAIHVAAPRHISFLAFCAANVITDVEPLYFMFTHQHPLHRFLHTFVGASLVWPTTLLLFVLAQRLASLVPLPNLFNWKTLTVGKVAIGAALGSYSHIVLDSLMHADIRPFAPFSESNPLLGLVSLSTLHWSCLLSGVLALVVLVIRRQARTDRP